MKPALVAFLVLSSLAAPAALAGTTCVATTFVDTNVSNQFRPSCIVVRSGDTITWGNSGIISHALATLEPRVAGVVGPCWESDAYEAGETVSVTFVTDGLSTSANGNACTPLVHDVEALLAGEVRIPYVCVFHPSMDGEIVVLAS